MQLKIYVDEAPIYITDKLTAELKKKSIQKDVLFLNEEASINVESILKALKKDKTQVIILGENVEKAKAVFNKHFTLIEAAGGIVQNEKKELLFIFRRGKWDLPKGKLEKNESPEICAAREIEEETGVKNLILKNKIGETYHVYEENNLHILKTSHWFYFTSMGKQKLAPQIEEDIVETKWIPTRSIKEPVSNTYQTIKDILSIFFDTP